MNTSSRFVVAIHIMTILDIAPRFRQIASVPSDFIAKSVNTNPVVVRRLLGMLRNADLVVSQPGAAGGSSLARPSERISLLDIYRAVEMGSLFPLHPSEPNPRCPIGRNIQDTLQDVLSKADQSMGHVLEGVTLHQITQDIMERAGMVDQAT